MFWWGDERFVPADSPDRNARQAREALLDHVGVDPAHVHEVPASDEVATAEDAAAAYSATLREHGRRLLRGADARHRPRRALRLPLPRPPGARRPATRSPSPSTTPPSRPPDRVTLTFEAMERCRAVWFIASGEGKADAVARALADEGSVEETPARGVRGDETVWWLDDAAASACST